LPEDNDLLVELLEKNQRVQDAKHDSYKQFYRRRFNSVQQTPPAPSTSSMFNWTGFLQAFGAMCLMGILVGTAWIAAENTGLMGDNSGKVATNPEVSTFEGCQEAGGELLDTEPRTCRYQDQEFSEPTKPTTPQDSVSVDDNNTNLEDDSDDAPQNTGGTCTQQIKYCWDGSVVRRDPKNSCQFMPCPTQPNQSSSQEDLSDVLEPEGPTCTTGYDGVCPAGCTEQTDADCCRNAGGILENGQCTLLQ
jgi:hypothetical protein